jgi:hypothetical protein
MSGFTVLSIDVGIRNLAFCVMEAPSHLMKCPIICQWDVIDLCPESDIPDKCCCCAAKAMFFLPDVHIANQTFPKKCERPVPENAPVCLNHANIAGSYSPAQVKPFTLKRLKQMEKDGLLYSVYTELQQLHPTIKNSTSVPTSSAITKEKQTFRNVYDQLRASTCTPIVRVSASKISLTEVTKNLAINFRNRSVFSGIDAVIIENQIGPKAVRMKAVQEVIVALAIYSGIDPKNIIGTSSVHKLTDVTLVPLKGPAPSGCIASTGSDSVRTPTPTPLMIGSMDSLCESAGDSGSANISVEGKKGKKGKKGKISDHNRGNKDPSKYTTHKSDGVIRCMEWLEYMEKQYPQSVIGERGYTPIQLFNQTKKKDDLADSFLQAIWGIKNQQK